MTTSEIQKISNVAVVMAASFRDKFDFSGIVQPDGWQTMNDYEKLAHISFESAKAIVAYEEKLLKAATDKKD